MDDFRKAETALKDRLKATCGNLGIDVTRAAQRLVLERIVDRENWQAAFGPAPVMLTGGCLVAQHHRQTSDADIRAVRRYSEQELVDGLLSLNDSLNPLGIHLSSARVRKVEVGLKHPVDRLVLQATAGGVRANSHVDISYAWGPDAWPMGVEEFEFPSLSPKFPSYKALAQPLESAVAEKWIAALMQPDNDLRAKYLVDLTFFYTTFDLDDAVIAAEMARVQRHQGIEWKDIVLQRNRVLSFEHIMARSEDWTRVCREKGIDVDPVDALLELGLAYRRLLPHRREHIFQTCRQRHAEREALVAAGEFPRHLPPKPQWDNVVAFRQ